VSAPKPHDEHESTENKVIHEVDGIQEYDNKLPNWWLYTLYGSMLFAAGYWFHYQTSGFGDLPRAEYQQEMDKAAAIEAARIKAAGVMTPEALAALSKDKGTVDQGKVVFAQTCIACHRQDGGGVVGPNLTDEFWIHGAAPEKIFKTISQGVPEKGMPAWAPQLGPDRTQAVTAYVISLRGTNVPNGKAPQGERDDLSQR
jgi:cytochrome c oxidase cbb3-type subunit III